MNAEWLLQNFERISEAADAIPRLRRFILDLALRGKLVGQCSKDEPAIQLLQRIEGEKGYSIRQKRRDVLAPHVGTENMVFNLPSGWQWCRLGPVIHLISGQHLQRAEYSDDSKAGIPYVTGPADFGQKGLTISRYALVRKAVAVGGQILLTVKGAGVGKTAQCDLPEVAISRQLMAMDAIGWNQRFLLLVTHLLATDLKERSRSLIPGISREDVQRFEFGFPPLAEQHRIVAKVDELMSFCDELEAMQAKREARRDRLVAATLHGLDNGESSEEAGCPSSFAENARFYFNHLPRLTTRPEHIHQLRQTILNLAVRGKLVPQDATDEPASELLMRIRRRKREMRAKNVDLADSANLLPGRTVPAGWEAVRFEQILLHLQTGPFGSSLHQQDYEDGGTPVVNPASLINGRIIPVTGMAIGPNTLERLATFKLRKNDVVMARRGEMGRCAVVTDSEVEWLCGTGSLILRFTDEVLPAFVLTLMSAPRTRQYLGGASVGATMQNLNQSILNDLPIGFPPLAEQRRIVGKVDELMDLCADLEVQLDMDSNTRHSLLKATLHQALDLG